MNEIEQKFYDSWMEYFAADCGLTEIEPGKVIGPYRVDFYVKERFCKFVFEIDGHDAHKTKEQRDHDYKRERYLQKQKIHVIRFMGTEVFLNAMGCVEEASEIMEAFGSDKLELMHCQHMCFEEKLIKRKYVED